MEVSEKKKPLKCEHCDLECTCRASLDIHLRTHFGIKPYICNLCGKAFSRKANCDRHEESHVNKKKFQCGVCMNRYTSKLTLTKHMQFHTGENLINCDLCDRQFTQNSHLRAHMRVHTGEKPYHCPYCEKKFAIEYDLKIHQTIHEGKTMTCILCGKIFHHLGSFRGHMIRHRQEKIFKCPVCGIDFHANCSLKAHMRTHTGEKPFRCEICNKTFTRNTGLKGHSAIHAKEKSFHGSGDDTSPASDLKKGSSVKHNLGSHICSICLKRYANKYSLNQHMKIHADKPFRCCDCDRVFSSHSYLTKHKETRACHVKKFTCPFCKNVFIKKVNIIIHVKTTHSVELEAVEESLDNAEKYYKCSVCIKYFESDLSRMWHEACFHKLVDKVECDVVMEQKLHAESVGVNGESQVISEVNENVYNLMEVVLDGNDRNKRDCSQGSYSDDDSNNSFPENKVFIKEEMSDDEISEELCTDKFESSEMTETEYDKNLIRSDTEVYVKEEVEDICIDLKEELSTFD